MFDKLYHSNKEQRKRLRVGELLLNSLVEALIHWMSISFTTFEDEEVSSSAEFLRRFFLLQFVIISRFKIFFGQETYFSK